MEVKQTHDDLIKEKAKILAGMQQMDLEEATRILKATIDAFQINDDEIENVIDKLNNMKG